MLHQTTLDYSYGGANKRNNTSSLFINGKTLMTQRERNVVGVGWLVSTFMCDCLMVAAAAEQKLKESFY